MKEATAVKSPMSVRNVGRPLAVALSSVDTRKSILVRSPISVSNVGKPSFVALTLPSIREFIRDRGGVNEETLPSESSYSYKFLWWLTNWESDIKGFLISTRIHTQRLSRATNDWTLVISEKPYNYRNRRWLNCSKIYLKALVYEKLESSWT